MRRSLYIFACTVAAGALGACAGSAGGNAEAGAAARTSAPALAVAENPNGPYTDDQLRAFVAVSQAVAGLDRGVTEEQRAEYTRRAGEILQQHGIGPVTYNAIAEHARTDQQLAQRIADIRLANLGDETLRRFIAASAEIQPISNSLASATAEQRAQAADQIGAILARHQLDAATYNAIAERAQTDQTLAARITALRQSAQSPG